MTKGKAGGKPMTWAWVSTAPGGTRKRVVPRGAGSGPGQAGGVAVGEEELSAIGLQHLPARFRQEQRCKQQQPIGDDREDRDGGGQRHGAGQIAD